MSWDASIFAFQRKRPIHESHEQTRNIMFSDISRGFVDRSIPRQLHGRRLKKKNVTVLLQNRARKRRIRKATFPGIKTGIPKSYSASGATALGSVIKNPSRLSIYGGNCERCSRDGALQIVAINLQVC